MTDVREERRPLVPQFTLRWLLGLTTVCAFLFAIVGLAARGHAWAIGISAGLGTVVFMAVIYALLFGCVWVAASILARRRAKKGQCPFRLDAAGSATAAAPGAVDQDVPIDAEIVS